MKKALSILLALCLTLGLAGAMLRSTASAAETLTPASDDSARHYTVQLGSTAGVYNYFLHNAEATDGPVTLRYTVSELTWKWEDDNVGLVASDDGDATFPQNTGLYSFENAHGASELLALGRTYTVVIGCNSDGTLSYNATYTDADNTDPVSVELPHDNSDSGNSGAGAKFFGLFSNRTVIATLTGVSCVDNAGKDLGVALNAGMQGDSGENINNCSIKAEDNGDQPEDPTNPAEPTDPEDPTEPTRPPITPVDEALFANAEHYTVTLQSDYNCALVNKLTGDGTVILRYTVSSLNYLDPEVWNNGVVASANPLTTYPYLSGSMWYEQHIHKIFEQGCTFTFVLTLDESDVLTYTAYYTEPGSDELHEIVFTDLFPDGASFNSKYFGFYISTTTSATLTDVMCVDGTGMDLGVQGNKATVEVSGGKEEPTEPTDPENPTKPGGNGGNTIIIGGDDKPAENNNTWIVIAVIAVVVVAAAAAVVAVIVIKKRKNQK